ncbi:tRNA (adenosine(37)-N6)-dimethylallyltransferase MiaA [uncultured Paracoccus sp.]|uniref:tRNA (adenosine(37)-N6)-dimethylallyltransferase MiaA n=1 Tax=uncultured Paracoccus sp. TaxID=189685 RepID=UPI0026037F13|nr:tRNA (adenosine(37)-N6)-dimethylallyltransferase MiaA [uncultured Paracoccus sp.]
MPDRHELASRVDPDRHVLIAGPTASGKSGLALALARSQGGIVVNADALQVWSCWRVLTARPSSVDEAAAAHALYGHVHPDQSYSVGDWLTEIGTLLKTGQRLIIVGGTGLYHTALTRGLAVIPPVPPGVRAQGDTWLADGGLEEMIAALDPRTRARLDLRNPARVQRAWEVLTATGRGLADWQADTPPPLIGPEDATRLVLHVDRDRLARRIAQRFDLMVQQGALDEVAAMLPHWDPRAQWARAIGAAELAGYLQGRRSLEDAREQSVVATRQYAKSQRIWFRNRMRDWTRIEAPYDG